MEDYNGITTYRINLITEFHQNDWIVLCVNKELYYFSPLLKYYMLHRLIYSFLSIWDFKNKWKMCCMFQYSELSKQLDWIYIYFKWGAMCELTQVARVRLASIVLPDVLV